MGIVLCRFGNTHRFGAIWPRCNGRRQGLIIIILLWNSRYVWRFCAFWTALKREDCVLEHLCTNCIVLFSFITMVCIHQSLSLVSMSEMFSSHVIQPYNLFFEYNHSVSYLHTKYGDVFPHLINRNLLQSIFTKQTKQKSDFFSSIIPQILD